MSRVGNTALAPYIACEDMDFAWDMTDVLDVIAMWQHGKPLQDMAEYLGRDPDEVAILLIDLARQGRITPREGGVMGHAIAHQTAV
jgi:hypothetical protein